MEITEKKLKTSGDSLDLLYNKMDVKKSLIRGVTTNPPLSMDVVRENSEYWGNFVHEYCLSDRRGDTGEIFRELYSEIVKRGAEMLMPVFENSGFKHGYISGQVDPRFAEDTREMVRQGIILNRISPNIMIKMPGTKEGIEAIEIMTALGIPTNATLTFTLSQLVAVAQAVERGLEIARRNNADLSKWRSVVTLMLGRLEDCAQFDSQAKERKIDITDQDRRWFGIAVFKKAYRLFKDRKYESMLLAASMRIGPVIDGKTRIWHAEKLIGGDLVLTIFPNIMAGIILNYEGEEIESKIGEPVPDDIIVKLSKIPYFREAYDENAIKPADFINHAAVRQTGISFRKAAEELENFCKDNK
ncbi:MAG: transaldolase family protein [Brevinematales bacterium]|jgi:transaldolase